MKLSNGNVRKLRQRAGLNQQAFWSRVGVTQSAGSRYETHNRRLPVPLQMLITIAYGAERDAARVATKLRAAA
jgi:transcriptional regulator with XRE-family HTH domain